MKGGRASACFPHKIWAFFNFRALSRMGTDCLLPKSSPTLRCVDWLFGAAEEKIVHCSSGARRSGETNDAPICNSRR